MTPSAARGGAAWARRHKNLLIIAGLVAACLAIDFLVFRTLQSHNLTSGTSLTGLYLAVFVPLTVAVPGLWYLIFVKRIRTESVFLLAATVFGLMLMLVRAPYTWFDENDHIYLAIYYSDVALGAEHGMNEEGQLTWVGRAEDANDNNLSSGAFSYHATNVGDYQLLARDFFAPEREPGKTTTLAVDDVGVFYQYLPATVGVTIAHLLHLGKVATLYLGKLFSLAFYILMVYLAIRISPKRFKTLFALLGLIPFILASAGTYSYDNMINVLSFLLIASVLRLAYDAENVRARDIVLLALLGTLLAPLKYVYVPLLFLPLIIPKEKWPRAHFRLYWCMGISLLGFAAIGLLTLNQAALEATRATADQSIDSYYPDAYTFKTFFEHPMVALRLLGHSIFQYINLIIDTPSGFTFSSRLPTWTHYLIFALLILSSSFNGKTRDADQPALFKMRKSARLIMLGLSVVVYLLVLLASINWTNVGAPLLTGVQGRYFIPLLPLLVIAVSGFIQPTRDLGRVSLYLFSCLSGLDLFFTFISVT
ncbi:MAG: DUF2142 domain-containing protein [Coriobacteriales bacterium]|jgi:uncharacterized membrane protein|nr:DUF2142 domain-containing protein [Coriobacteriales bacterium]